MSLSNKDDIQVSVCVVTYNQENYIAECLESLVTQQTSFKFEIIVGEDFSTDGTRAIVQQYVEQYPNLIIPIFYEKNVGAVENVKQVYKAAKGKYIAHMDGDDMALPNKLQKQFDVLESNPDCVICAHNMRLITFDNVMLDRVYSNYNKTFNDIFDLYARLPFFAHSSKMFIKTSLDGILEKLHPFALDIEIHIQQAKRGNIYYLSDCCGVYRVGVGVSSLFKKLNPLLISGNDRVYRDSLIHYKSNSLILRGYYSKCYLNFAYQAAVFGDKEKYIYCARKSLKIKIISIQQVVIYLFTFSPFLFILIAKLRNKSRYI